MLEKIVITALSVLACWATMWEGAIFSRVRTFFTDLLEETPWEKWENAIFDCPICMTPYYGSLVYWAVWANGIGEWLVVVVGAMGLNVALTKLFREEE